ncbi:hypothetical protein NMY22_g18879 [Coprinellus aureogranulatus]|nr:hypothetical protein NMY22_g18879 [Coprinellus aureogranulatus]
MEITAVNGPDAAHPFVGAVGGSAGYNFNPGQLGYTYLSGTGHTAANSPPSFSAGHSIQSLGVNGPTLMDVRSFTPFRYELYSFLTTTAPTIPAQPTTRIFYDPSVDFIGLIGDFDKFVSTFPNEGAVLVTLTFIPVP